MMLTETMKLRLTYSMLLLVFFLDGPKISWIVGTTRRFQPKILLTVDDNIAVSADLSPSTRIALEELMSHRNELHQQLSSNKIVEIEPDSESATQQHPTAAHLPHGTDYDDSNDSMFETDEEIAHRRNGNDIHGHVDCLDSESTHVDDEMADDDDHTKRTIEITLRAD